MMSRLSEVLLPVLFFLRIWILLSFWMLLPLQTTHPLGVAALPSGQRPIRHNHNTNTNRHHPRNRQSPDHSDSGRLELEQARVDAIKQDLLNKIGMDRVPDVSRFNVSTEEMRKKLRLYRDSLENTRENTHTLFEDDQYMAKDFHEIKFSGKETFCKNVYHMTFMKS